MIEKLWSTAVPIQLAAAVMGTILGLIFNVAMKRFASIMMRVFGHLSSPEAFHARVDEDVQHCPRCNSAMDKMAARRGRNAGSYFWGCSRFPECKGSRSV